MSDLERKLEDLFLSDSRSRRVGSVDIAARRGGAFTSLAALGGVAALALVAIAVFSLLRGDREALPAASPSASSSPTGSAMAVASPDTARPSASPSPSSTAPATADRYGYVDSAQGQVAVRRERDGTTAFQLAGTRAAVSSDGRRIAYWRVPADGGASELRALDVADPSTDHLVYRVPEDSLGGAIVWSNDSLGLLVTTYSRATVGPAGGPPGSGAPAKYDLLMVDLAATPAKVAPAAPTATHGFVYLPVGWDRPGRLAAGVITGEGGFTRDYVLWNGNASTPMSQIDLAGQYLAGSVQASPDGKTVVALEFSNPPTVRVWPLDDPSKRRAVGTGLVSRAMWRTSSDLVWTVARNVLLVRIADGSATTIYTSADEHVVAISVRSDGSGVVVREGSGEPNSTKHLSTVDVATHAVVDAWTQTTLNDVDFAPRGVALR